MCIRRFSTVTKACESPSKANSNGSAQHMASLWGKSSIPLTTALDEPFEQGFGKAYFIWGTWSTFLTVGEIWWVVGRAGDFPSFTPPGKHILISSQCSILTQHQRLPVKALNSAWTVKLCCEERLGRPQEWSARHVPALQPCGNAASPVHPFILPRYNTCVFPYNIWETGNSYFHGDKEVTNLAWQWNRFRAPPGFKAESGSSEAFGVCVTPAAEKEALETLSKWEKTP